MKLKLKIISGIMIFLAVFFSGIIQNIVLKALLASFAAILPNFSDLTAGYLEKRKEKRRKEEIVRKYVLELSSFISKYFPMVDLPVDDVLNKIVSLDFDLSRENVYKLVIDSLDVEECDKSVIFILALSYEIDKERDEIIKSKYKDVIDKVLENFDFINLCSKTRKLLEKYAEIKGIKVTEGDYRKLLMEFSKKYCKVTTFAFYIFRDYEQAVEFKRTLSVLISQGKLNIPLIKHRLKQKISSFFKGRHIQSGYIVLMNKYQRIDSVRESLDKFPHIRVGRLYPKNFPEEAQFLHMRIVYPQFQYHSTKEFIEKEIISKIPEEKRGDGWVAVMSIETTDISIYPDSREKIKDEKMKKSYDVVNYLITGLGKDINEILSEYYVSEIELNEILSVIPFNIFVPNLKKEAKDFLIENYEILREYFKIETLFDWARIDPDDLAEKIISLDKGNILSDQQWKKVASKICMEAKKHVEAIS